MNRLDELFKKLEYYDHLRNTSKMTITSIPKPRNPGKVPSAYTLEKADSPGNFWERNLILLLAFIFMICLANLITTLILIYFFLENLH
jgi:hypothetical protein